MRILRRPTGIIGLCPLLVVVGAIGCHSRRVSETPIAKPGELRGTIRARTIDDPTPHDLKLVIALLPLQNRSDRGDWESIGVKLNDLLEVKLAPHPELRIVEREKLKSVLDELYLGETSADPETAIRVGKLVGANVLFIGSYSQEGNGVLVAARLVKVETGEIIGGLSEKDNVVALDRLATRIADRLVNETKRTGAPPIQ